MALFSKTTNQNKMKSSSGGVANLPSEIVLEELSTEDMEKCVGGAAVSVEANIPTLGEYGQPDVGITL